MTEASSATTGQAPGAQPQAGTLEAPTSAQAAAGTPETTSETVDVVVLQRELSEARREAAKHRTDLRRLTDAQLSETERLQKRVTELEAEREELATRERERAVRFAALEAANRLGFRDPELAVRLLDREAVEIKDDGTPKNVEKLLADLLAKSPYLGRSGTPVDFGGGPRGQVPAGSDMNSLIRRAAGRI